MITVLTRERFLGKRIQKKNLFSSVEVELKIEKRRRLKTTNFSEHDNMGVPYDLTIKNKYCRMENCFPEYSNS